MSWKKSNSLLTKRLQQHGLAEIVQAGLVCKEAERLYPGLFKAVSLRKTCLHIELTHAHATDFLMIKGKLLKDLQVILKEKNLPVVERFTLTYTNNPATV